MATAERRESWTSDRIVGGDANVTAAAGRRVSLQPRSEVRIRTNPPTIRRHQLREFSTSTRSKTSQGVCMYRRETPIIPTAMPPRVQLHSIAVGTRTSAFRRLPDRNPVLFGGLNDDLEHEPGLRSPLASQTVLSRCRAVHIGFLLTLDSRSRDSRLRPDQSEQHGEG